MLEVFRMRKILPDGLWNEEKIDFAEFMHGLLAEAK